MHHNNFQKHCSVCCNFLSALLLLANFWMTSRVWRVAFEESIETEGRFIVSLNLYSFGIFPLGERWVTTQTQCYSSIAHDVYLSLLVYKMNLEYMKRYFFKFVFLVLQWLVLNCLCVILMWAWRRPFMVWRSGKCVARRIIPTYCYCNDEGTPSLVFSSPAILLAPVKAANVEAAERSSSMTFPCSVCMVTEVRTWSEMWCCFEGRNLALTSRLVLMERTLLNFIFACLIFLKLYQATALSGPH